MNTEYNHNSKLKMTNSQICPIQQVWPILNKIEKYKEYRTFLERLINSQNLPTLTLKTKSEIYKSEAITHNFLNLGNLVHEQEFKISTDSEQMKKLITCIALSKMIRYVGRVKQTHTAFKFRTLRLHYVKCCTTDYK